MALRDKSSARFCKLFMRQLATPDFTTRRDEHEDVCAPKGFATTQCSRSKLAHKSGDLFFTLHSSLPLISSEEEPQSYP